MLRAKYGWEGEGKFWALNNIIAKSEGCRLNLSKKYNKAAIAVELNFTLKELDEFVEYLSNPNECSLLKRNGHTYTAEILQENLEKVNSERNRGRKKTEKVKISAEKKKVYAEKPLDNDKEKSFSSVKETKVKETKVNKKKVNIDLAVVEKTYFDLFENETDNKPDYKWARDRKIFNDYLKNYESLMICELLQIWFWCNVGAWHGYTVTGLIKDFNKLLVMWKNLGMNRFTEQEYEKYQQNVKKVNQEHNKNIEVPEYGKWREENFKRRFAEISISS